MNLWLRLLTTLLLARRRGALALPAGVSVLHFRVWPHDLDLSLHMNNGRYLTLMDLGRLDVLVRCGLWRAVGRNGWTPIASAIKIRFRREMHLFDRFRLETRLVAWDKLFVVMEQVFVLDRGPHAGTVAAQALFKGGLYDRSARQFVPIAQLMQEIGIAPEGPPLTREVEAFLDADEALKQSRSVSRRAAELQ
ncbi:MAG: thioesterase family protein [Pseudomonadota bacterium]